MLGLKQFFNKSVDLIKQVQDQVQQTKVVSSSSLPSTGKEHPGRLLLARLASGTLCCAKSCGSLMQLGCGAGKRMVWSKSQHMAQNLQTSLL
jgi:hypothetical protein